MMNRSYSTTGFVVLMTLLGVYSAQSASGQQDAFEATSSQFTSRAISFTKNMGQLDKQVFFQAEAGKATLYFHADGVTTLFMRDAEQLTDAYDIPFADRIDLPDRNYARRHKKEVTVVRTSFVGADPQATIVGLDRQPHHKNYIIGNDAGKWHTAVPSYSGILYSDIYDNIDLKYYSRRRAVKYDYVVHPGGDVSDITVRYDGMDDLAVTDQGKLRFNNGAGYIEEGFPRIYQDVDGKKVEIRGRYEVKGSSTFGFAIDAAYDTSRPLVIDPVLSYCSFLGGSNEDWGYAVAVSNAIPPYIYVVGHTWSPDFPWDGWHDAHDTIIGGTLDAFVSKYDPSGTELVYSTYLGGGGDEWGYGAAIYGTDSICITGATSSSDFPCVNAFDDSPGGAFDGFVTILCDTGGVVFSTYWGGSSYDVCNDVAVDASHCVYLTGMTYSSDFPTTGGSYQESCDGYWDAFVTKLNYAANDTVYSTYLGGSEIETAYGIALDNSNNVCITGWTWSEDFDTTAGAYQTAKADSQDVFVTKLKAPGDSLLYSTYLGGDSADYGKDIAIGNPDTAYITGWTKSDNFPADNYYISSTDAFVAKLSTDSPDMIYSVLLGGTETDCGYGIAVDNESRPYIVGRTESPTFATAGTGRMPYTDSSDAFLTILNAQGNGYVYSTCLGDTANDWGYGISLYEAPLPIGRTVYLTGKTGADSLPNSNTYLNPYSGNYDAFLAMFLVESITLPVAAIDSIIPDSTGYGAEVKFYGSGTPEEVISFYRWVSDIDGYLGGEPELSIFDLSVGEHNIYLSVQDTLFAWSAAVTAPVEITIDVSNPPVAVIDSIKPNPVDSGLDVHFGGHGVDPPGDNIEEWEWMSDREEGYLSDTSAFSINELSVGSHTISFRVKDDEDNWSDPVTENLQVTKPVQEYWEISWWYPEYVGEFSLLMHDYYACTLYVTNISQHEQEFNFRVNRSDQHYSWAGSVDPPHWSLSEVGDCDMNGNSYTWGAGLADSYAPGETRKYVFTTSNDWNWIPSWQLFSLLSMIGSFVPITPVSTALEICAYIEGAGDFALAPTKWEYTYTLAGDATQVGQTKVDTAYVRPEKIDMYWLSILSAFIGARSTNVGWAVLPVPVVGQALAAVFFVLEGLYYAVSYISYSMAWDPNPDYTEYVSPGKPDDIACDSTIDKLEEGCWKYAAYEAEEMYVFADAALQSYARCVGAMQAGSTEWAAKQMAISYYYTGRVNALTQKLNRFSHSLAANVDPPDSAAVEVIKDSIQNGDLPEIEDEVIAGLGLPVDADSVATWFFNGYDSEDWEEFAGSYIGMADTVDVATSYMADMITSLYARGLNGVVLGEVVNISPHVIVGVKIPRCTLWVEFPELGLPEDLLTGCSLIDMAVNDNSANVDDHMPPQLVDDYDGDEEHEIKLPFTPVAGAAGYHVQSIYGTLITPSNDTLSSDTLSFSAAAVLEIVAAGDQTALCGDVRQSSTFDPISGVQVTVYRDSQYLYPQDTQYTDSDGRFCCELDDTVYTCYVTYEKPGEVDESEGPIYVSPGDTTGTCMILVQSCCTGTTMGNVDCEGIVDIGDVTELIMLLFIRVGDPFCCEDEADLDYNGDIDIGDLTMLISALFITLQPPGPCP